MFINELMQTEKVQDLYNRIMSKKGENEMSYPEAKAHLERGPDSWLWVVDVCPLCGDKHIHGGGPFTGNPRNLLGHRAAHCTDTQDGAGYILVEKGG